MLFAFSMDVNTAMLFYQRCQEREAITALERHEILLEMVQEGLIKNMTATERSKEQYMADLAKNFNVIDVRKKENGDEHN